MTSIINANLFVLFQLDLKGTFLKSKVKSVVVAPGCIAVGEYVEIEGSVQLIIHLAPFVREVCHVINHSLKKITFLAGFNYHDGFFRAVFDATARSIVHSWSNLS